MNITIAAEDPLSDDMRALVAELTDLLHSLTPADACHHLSVEEMANDQTTVFVARVDGMAAACGALYRHGGGVAEVKRMYTRPGHQGLGLGRKILNQLIAIAEEEDFKELVLETGHTYEAAKHLYQSSGFTQCGAVLDYPEHPESIFYKRPISAGRGTLS